MTTEGTSVAVSDADRDGGAPRGGRAVATTESGRRLRWWRELVYVIAFYVIYSAVRNTFGSSGTGGQAVANAFGHAKDVISFQRFFGLWFEPRLQRWYLDLPGRGGIKAWNIYYASAHFVVTVLAMVVLYRRQPDRYPIWRNTLAFMTALALIGFASFSLMPPRLLGDTSQYGACHRQVEDCHGYGLEDTLQKYGGLFSFDSGAVAKVSNQYAAMPSMHTGWSTWCALVFIPMIRRRWAKVLMAMYPVATVFCILITGNHYWLDAVGGLVALGGGYLIGSAVSRALERRLASRAQAPVPASA